MDSILKQRFDQMQERFNGMLCQFYSQINKWRLAGSMYGECLNCSYSILC